MSTQAETRRQIANKILPSIEAGYPPWRSSAGRGLPTNPQTGRKYSGINPLILDAVADQRKYRSKYWCTYRQWGILHLQVQKRPNKYAEGEWGTDIINWQPFRKAVDKGNILSVEKFHLIHTYSVFNAEQTFGQEIGKYLITKADVGDYLLAESVIKATGADIQHPPECVTPKYYRPDDQILLPPREFFLDDRQYTASKLHELAHYSEFRVGWGGRSEDQGELFAEIVTGYMESELGLPHDPDMTNHNKWMPIWVERIKENPKYLFDAAAYAARSIDWIMGFTRNFLREELVLHPEDSGV